jgi:hypothetical protein
MGIKLVLYITPFVCEADQYDKNTRNGSKLNSAPPHAVALLTDIRSVHLRDNITTSTIYDIINYDEVNLWLIP